MKTLSTQLAEVEPPFVQSKLLKESAWVDRASYERLRQVAIVLAEACERIMDFSKAEGLMKVNAYEAIAKAADILGEK